MAYDETLAARVRALLARRAPADEKKMFGGLAFMVCDHLACGLLGDDLMVRVGAQRHAEALARGAREMEMTGRPMRGMVMVAGEHVADDDTLAAWVDWSVEIAQTSPPKAPRRPRRS